MTRFKVKYMKVGVHVACTLFAGPDYAGPFEMLGRFNCTHQEFLDLQMEMRNIPFEDREVVDDET